MAYLIHFVWWIEQNVLSLSSTKQVKLINTFETMKNCFIVYCGDAWLSYNSLSTIAVCTTLNKAISLIKKDAVKQGITLSEDDLFNLKAIYQTQGNDINYQISEIQMNKIIY